MHYACESLIFSAIKYLDCMCAKNVLYYYEDDIKELLNAFPNRRFKNLDIKNTLGEERASYYARRIRKLKEEGLVRSIGRCNIHGHKQSNIWEIPSTIADNITGKTTTRKRVRIPFV